MKLYYFTHVTDKKQFDDKDEEGELFAPDNEDYDPSSSKGTLYSSFYYYYYYCYYYYYHHHL